MMRVLTVRQPWAWAIIYGGKDVENRSRNIAGDYRGPVAIHAGQTVDMAGMTDRNVIGSVAIRRLFAGAGHLSTFKESPRGAIIGVVDLVSVHRCWWAEGLTGCSPWAEKGFWHLALTNARPLVEPIPFKGALGLRTLPVEVEAQIQGMI